MPRNRDDVAIFDCNRCLGQIAEQESGRYAAFAASGRFLGEYANKMIAIDAIIQAGEAAFTKPSPKARVLRMRRRP
jgi:hypothetical protein